ncbi:caspase domain-containing protein [Phormidesmis sp. 146-12]
MGKAKSQIAGKVVATALDVSEPLESWQSRENLTPIQTSKGTKVALLIGVSEYGQDFPQIPGAVKDVEAMRDVLTSPRLGDFDQVIPLVNPDSQEVRQAIKSLFTGRTQDDLVLLFFSGHGFKDSGNELHLGTRTSRKNLQGDLSISSTVSASFICNIMNDCRSKRQVVILDCCFSGAFPEGLVAKDDSSVDLKTQLGGKGRAILSSSSSTQISFGQQVAELSPYTRYLVEGICTGEADLDRDHLISVNDLHQYVKNKIQARFPALKPAIYAEQEGLRIMLARAEESSEVRSLFIGSSIENRINGVNGILAQNLSQRFISLVRLIVLLLLGSTILVSFAIRFGCQALHESWLAGGSIRAKYNTGSDEPVPEKKICKAIGIPIDRSRR